MVTGNAIVEKARELIGYPYRWGGDSPKVGGFDCSGLIYYVYKSFGINISRTTYTQIDEGIRITDKNKLQQGDLIFNFDKAGVPQHVFLYSGNGYVIEAKYEGTLISEHNKWVWEGIAVRILKNDSAGTVTPVPSNSVKSESYYRVICGSYKDRANAVEQQIKLGKAGFHSFIAIYNESTGKFFRVVVGSFAERENAVKCQQKLDKSGFDSFLIVFKK